MDWLAGGLLHCDVAAYANTRKYVRNPSMRSWQAGVCECVCRAFHQSVMSLRKCRRGVRCEGV